MTPQCTQSLLYLLTHLTSWRDSTVYSKILTIDVLYFFLKQMKSMHTRATTGFISYLQVSRVHEKHLLLFLMLSPE